MTISQLVRLSGAFRSFMLASAVAVPLSGCAIMSAAGPSSRSVNRADGVVMANNASIRIVDVSDAVARRLIASQHDRLFSESLGDGYPAGSIIGRGDVLDIAIWEAPPPALFGFAAA